MVRVPLGIATFTYWRDGTGGTENRAPVPPGRPFDPAKMWQEGERYVDLLIGLLVRPSKPEQGMDLAEMRRVNKLIDKLEVVSLGADHVDLEDAEYDLAKQRIESGRYSVMQRPFLKFADDVCSARERQEAARTAATAQSPLKA